MSFSNGGGGTLALPSPTHAHRIDVTSAVRSIRRSISRSPSRFLSRASSQIVDCSRQASPQSPCRRSGATPQRQHIAPSQPQTAPPALTSEHAAPLCRSPLLTPLRPARLSLRSARSTKTSSNPSRPATRVKVSSKSPLKRTAGAAAPDSGNSRHLSNSPSPTSTTPRGPNNNTPSPRSAHNLCDKSSRHSFHLDMSGSSYSTSFGPSIAPSNDSFMFSTSGALKRSDATMNLDYPNQGSPVAKRRSLHGISSFQQTGEPNLFSSTTVLSQGFDIHEDALPSDYELTGDAAEHPNNRREPLSNSTNLPKRSSSLRKSTLQQRYGDRGGSWGRRSGERQLAQLAQMGGEKSSPARNRPRLCLDQFVPPQPLREEPSAPPGQPLIASNHNLENRGHQPHPLSKTLTTSISGNSLTEQSSCTAQPPKLTDRPRPHPFSRSLPMDASRPAEQSASPSQSGHLWTPAFNSTGLISKVNRYLEADKPRKIAPPDTPCKKHANAFATFPPPVGSAIKRKMNNRNSFAGLPSTPFHPTSSRGPDTFTFPGKGLSIFASKSSRRGSILSLEGGEDQRLFCDMIDLPSLRDGDVSPTPTKTTILTPSPSNLSDQSLESPSAHRTFILPPHSAVKSGPFPGREATSSPVDGRRTPQTPQETQLPLDTSRLSIAQRSESFSDNHMPPPVTPTTARDFRSSTSIFITPVNVRTSNIDVDFSLRERFDTVEAVGEGEFSTVYRVTKAEHPNAFESGTPSNSASRSPTRNQVFAVKKSRRSYNGHKDRAIKLREVRILQALTNADHVVHYVDSWEHNFHLYIQTEFCDEGTLDHFLGNVGNGGRLDDFRIFKILEDLCRGLKEIHDAGFMHLDMKPANILITFEGVLKIGDFGLAQSCNNEKSIDVEGDREYMAPEMLNGKADQSADVFSLGLMTLEIAANVALPHYGPSWIRLRSGDLSEVPSLTWAPSEEGEGSASRIPTDSAQGDELCDRKPRCMSTFGLSKRSDPQQPPEFMTNVKHPSSLETIVISMTSQDPEKRPHVDQVLGLEGLQWVSEHRDAPATVYEGTWGPMETIHVSIAVDDDTEMTDV